MAQERILAKDLTTNSLDLVRDSSSDDLQELGSNANSVINGNVRITQTPSWQLCSGSLLSSDQPAMAQLIERETRSDGNDRHRSLAWANDHCHYVVRDDLHGRSVSYDIRLHGAEMAAEMAAATLNQWRTEHRDENKGEYYADILYFLQTFEGFERDDLL